FELAQDERGNLWRRELAIAKADSDRNRGTTRFRRVDPKGILRRIGHIVRTLAHESLDGVGGAGRVGEQATLRVSPDVNRSVGRDRDNRWNERVAVGSTDDERCAVPDVRDQAVRRAEIDTDDFSHG